MTDVKQIEMRIHDVKDRLASIEAKLNIITEQVMSVCTRLDESEKMFSDLQREIDVYENG